MVEKKISFKNNKGQKLIGIIHIPDKNKKYPAVIICHGFKQTKEQIIPLVLSRNLSVNGFVVLRFDFANWGESDGHYSDMTFSQEIKDVDYATKYLLKQKFVAKKKIGLAGLSLGGGVTLIASANNPEIVKTVVAFSPAVDFYKIITKYFGKKDQIAKWKKGGYAYIYDQGRDIYWKFNLPFYYDSQKTKALDYVDKIKCPVLMIQGTKDNAVSISDNKKFYNLLKAPKKILLIKGGDHQYRQINALNKAIIEATNWFKKHLV
ncbi:alpha/beta fold hydrolase [Patescibacteria group bacterium]|nr:alpha/beta fold hydrolase [Patescibacteria group bacterium]